MFHKSRAISAAVLSVVLSGALAGCSANIGGAGPLDELAVSDTFPLTSAQISEGFLPIANNSEVAYRIWTEAETGDLSCYSAKCGVVEFVALQECKQVRYVWQELDSSGNVLGRGSQTAEMYDNPQSELNPRIGFVTSDSNATATFLVSSAECLRGSQNSKVEPEAPVEPAQPVVQQIQVPNLYGLSTSTVERWKRDNWYQFNLVSTTALGYLYDIPCRMADQDSVVNQRPLAGTYIEDSPMQTIWIETTC